MDLWGSRKGILIVCFIFSKLQQRSSNAAASSCGRVIFDNAPRVDADIFNTDKKDAFSFFKNIRIRVDEASDSSRPGTFPTFFL